MVCLTTAHINDLKTADKLEAFDSAFISILLSAVFGDDVLKVSSAGGRKSNFNSAKHQALDIDKLKFVKGTQFFNFKRVHILKKCVLQMFLRNELKKSWREQSNLSNLSTKNVTTFDDDKSSKNGKLIKIFCLFVK